MEDLVRSTGLRLTATGLQGSDAHTACRSCAKLIAPDAMAARSGKAALHVSDRHAKGDETAHSAGSVERIEVERDRAARAETPGQPSLPKIGKTLPDHHIRSCGHIRAPWITRRIRTVLPTI